MSTPKAPFLGRRQRYQRPGQANMLAQALKARRTKKRSILAPYEKAKEKYRKLERIQQRRVRRRLDMEKKLRALKETTATMSERVSELFGENGPENMTKEQQRQLTSAINRTLVLTNKLEQLLQETRKLDNASHSGEGEKLSAWTQAKKSLVALGTQLVDQLEEHEKTTESWMKIQFNVDMTTAGTGVAKLPGRIAYSPFTIYDSVYDTLDATAAATVNKGKGK